MNKHTADAELIEQLRDENAELRSRIEILKKNYEFLNSEEPHKLLMKITKEYIRVKSAHALICDEYALPLPFDVFHFECAVKYLGL